MASYFLPRGLSYFNVSMDFFWLNENQPEIHDHDAKIPVSLKYLCPYGSSALTFLRYRLDP